MGSIKKLLKNYRSLLQNAMILKDGHLVRKNIWKYLVVVILKIFKQEEEILNIGGHQIIH